MFKCTRCTGIMDPLAAGVLGRTPREIEAILDRASRAVARAIWGQDVPRGRGRTLDGLIWIERTPGPRPEFRDAGQLVMRVQEWLRHLAAEQVAETEILLAHIGGRDDELGVQHPPDLNPLLRAFEAVKDRLHPDSAADPGSKATAYRAIVAARRLHRTSTDRVRKAAERGPVPASPFDHRVLILHPPPAPGSPRIFVDVKELERRHPGTWNKLVGERTT